MAKIKSLFEIKGTIDGINIYMLNGQWVARKSGGGFTRAAIKKKKTMKRVRQQKSEFASAVDTNMKLRHAVGFLWGNFKFTYLHSRMQGLMQRIKDLDKESAFGQRDAFKGLVTEPGLAEVQAFTYSPLAPLETVLPYTVTMGEDASKIVLQLEEGGSFPKMEAATHVSLRLGVAVVDAEGHCFDRFGSAAVTVSLDSLPETLQLTTEKPVEGTGPKLVFVRVWYGKQEGDKLTLLRNKAAVSVGCVGVVK